MNIILLQAAQGDSKAPFFLLAIFAVFFYFIIFRPQKKKEKQLKKLREDLKKDDAIITAGGIHGKVMEVDEDSVVIAVESAAKLRVDKSSIAVVNGVAGPAKK